MRIALMQPYFMPYVGYFQLMAAVDLFILYDDVEYSKGGWINRNRILLSGEPRFLTVSLERSSHSSRINERRISTVYDCAKSMRLLDAAYARAPYWNSLRDDVQGLMCHRSRSLVQFNARGLDFIARLLGLSTPMCLSSDTLPNVYSSGSQRVLDLCHAVGATEYINAIGGLALYSIESFRQQGVDLKFLRSRLSPYNQGGYANFVPALSILDALAWIGPDGTSQLVASDYDIVGGEMTDALP